jgi:hypothetical protein
MSAKHGGFRRGAGRPRGSKNRSTLAREAREREALAAARQADANLMPIDYLLRVLFLPTAPARKGLWAAMEIVLRVLQNADNVPGRGQTKQDTRRRAFNRQLKAAQEKDLIGVREINGTTFVWFEQPNQGGTWTGQAGHFLNRNVPEQTFKQIVQNKTGGKHKHRQGDPQMITSGTKSGTI